MKVYITDLQRKKLILESASNDIENISNESKKLGESILDEVKKQTNLDLGILLSWSASIGGFMSPLNDIIQGKFPEFSDSDRFLVLSGLLFSVLYQNKKFFNTVKDKLIEKGLYQFFLDLLPKAERIKDNFLSFLSSVGIYIDNISKIIGFTFVIPILPIIYGLVSQGDILSLSVEEIVKRILMYLTSVTVGVTVKKFLTKVVSKMKKNN
jgi:hypothetical protein